MSWLPWGGPGWGGVNQWHLPQGCSQASFFRASHPSRQSFPHPLGFASDPGLREKEVPRLPGPPPYPHPIPPGVLSDF